MITAKNYAAQVEKHCREFRKHYEKNKMSVDASTMLILEQLIIDAQHFAIPDNGVIFDDNLKGAAGLEFRMPYLAVTIEYYMPSDKRPIIDGLELASSKRMSLCIDCSHPDVQDIFGRVIGRTGVLIIPFWDSPDGWGIQSHALFIPKEWDNINGAIHLPSTNSRAGKEPAFAASNIEILPQTIDCMRKKMRGKEFCALISRHIDDMSSEARPVLEFFEALSCSNVTATPLEKIDPAKNARRIRDGKLPIYETKVLTVDCPSARYPRQSTGEPSNRASPREHLRRGHIRRLESGKRIWVNSAVIGSAGIGRIDKRYEIRSAA